MFMLIVYLVYLLIFSLIFLISYLFSKKRIKNAVNKFKEPIYEIKLFDDMLDLEDRYKTLLKKDYFKDHPLLKSLFSDISSCLNQVDDLKLSKIRVVPTTPEDEKILLSEIENAPKAVQKLCQSKNELALSIVFYNYGVAKGKFPFPVKKSRFSKIRCIVLVLFLIIKISMSMFINRQKPIESRKALIQNIHEPTKYCQYICA